MKPPKLFAKIAVLSFFIVFLVGFVAYRSGAFDKWLNGSPEVQPADMNTMMAAQDNTIVNIDSPPRGKTIMSSSKYMPLTKEKTVYDNFDSTKPPKPGAKMIMISGSKSGAMIPIGWDTTEEKAKVDKILGDRKPAPPKPKADTPVYRSAMSGSKSAILIRPGKDTSKKK